MEFAFVKVSSYLNLIKLDSEVACIARTHPLSPYTPLCTKCGFILCSLHAPAYPCPHCSNPLTTPPSKDALIDKIKQEIGDLLQREQEERERQKLEHEKAVGAFPTLATSTGYPEPIKPSQPRKVLSLNQQTRKVTVASYTALSIAAPSSPSSQEEAVYRVPRPPKEVDYVRGKLAIDGRRWENLRDGGIVYVPLPVISHPQGSGGGKKKGKRVPGS